MKSICEQNPKNPLRFTLGELSIISFLHSRAPNVFMAQVRNDGKGAFHQRRAPPRPFRPFSRTSVFSSSLIFSPGEPRGEVNDITLQTGARSRSPRSDTKQVATWPLASHLARCKTRRCNPCATHTSSSLSSPVARALPLVASIDFSAYTRTGLLAGQLRFPTKVNSAQVYFLCAKNEMLLNDNEITIIIVIKSL